MGRKSRKTHSRSRLATAVAGILVLLLAVGFVIWSSVRPVRTPRVAAPLPQDVYVWQRNWTPAVKQAIRDHAPTFGSVVALSTEVEWKAGKPRAVRVGVDYGLLSACGARPAVALRVGPYPGPYLDDDEIARMLKDTAEGVIARAREGGIEPVELQLDFDAAASKLDGYRVWVNAIRKRIAPTPLVITTVPSWCWNRSFGPLVEACDGFILQVHSLDRPELFDAEVSLCDPADALRGVKKAATFGRPFRIALPTYAYVLAFDAGGNKYLGLSAEGPKPAWPADAKLRRLDSDAAAIAGLVRTWRDDPPDNLKGLIWYRLPTADDRMNWRWTTLASVMEGKTPTPRVRVETERSDNGLVEIRLVNAGDADGRPGAVTLDWSGATLLASDEFEGFKSSDAGPGAFSAKPSMPSIERLRPGETRKVGWIRLSADTEVHAHVQDAKP